MPRYFFRLTDGRRILKVSQGLDLPGVAAARADALVLVRDLKRGQVMPARNWNGWFLTVADRHGHEVERLPLSDVPAEPELSSN